MKTKSHQSKDEVEGGVVADIVVIDSLSVLKLLSAKDDALLFGWDALLCVAKEGKVQGSVSEVSNELQESFGEKIHDGAHFPRRDKGNSYSHAQATHSRRSWP